MNSFLRQIGLCLFVLIGSQNLFAQDSVATQKYALQLGAFKYPPQADYYKSLSQIGQVYYVQVGELKAVLIGNYDSVSVADSVLHLVKQKGFSSAIIRAFDADSLALISDAPANALTLYSVQLGAFKNKNSMPNYQKLSESGQLYEILEDNFTKIRYGVYQDEDSAKLQLEQIQKMGFPKAFICQASMLPPQFHRFFQPVSIYKRMEGKFNQKLSVVVHTYFTEASIKGFYNDPRNGKRKMFMYYNYKDSHISAAISSAKTSQYTSSSLNTSYRLNISVKDQESSENIHFDLVEKYPTGSVQFDVVSIFKKKLAEGNNGEMGMDLYLEYPVMKNTLNKAMEEKFNSISIQISNSQRNLGEKLDTQLTKDLQKIKQYYPQYRWLSETYETKILENHSFLLSAKFSKESVIVEPETHTFFRSFDLKTGKQLVLEELLIPTFQAGLRAILEKKLNDEIYKNAHKQELKQSMEEMLKNYYFTTTGIVFSRDYKSSYRYKEAIELSVAYSQVAHLIRKDSFLKNFMN